MADAARFRRTAAVTGLASAAVLGPVSRLLYQPAAGDPAAQLAAEHAAHGRAVASAAAFVLYELAAIAAALGIGHLLRGRAPGLSNVGTALAVVGAFGDTVAGAVQLVWTQAAQDPAHTAVYADLVRQTTPVTGPFSLLGLAGSVLGTLLLSIGLFRTRTGPRWTGPALWAFLVLEFVGSSVVPVLGDASVLLALLAYAALAGTALRSPRSAWATAGAGGDAGSGRRADGGLTPAGVSPPG